MTACVVPSYDGETPMSLVAYRCMCGDKDEMCEIVNKRLFKGESISDTWPEQRL